MSAYLLSTALTQLERERRTAISFEYAHDRAVSLSIGKTALDGEYAIASRAWLDGRACVANGALLHDWLGRMNRISSDAPLVGPEKLLLSTLGPQTFRRRSCAH
jgi:hypothetical protein